MRIAVIGTGNVGATLAKALKSAGHEVVVAASKDEHAEAAAKDLGALAARTPADAAAGAQAIILAVPFAAVHEVAAEISEVAGGIPIVDVTNGPRLLEEGASNAEQIQDWLPDSPVVKAFNSAFASRMAEPQERGDALDGFYAGNDAAAKERVGQLVRDVGFEPIDTGDLRMARVLEGMAWLNIQLNMANNWSWRSAWQLAR